MITRAELEKLGFRMGYNDAGINPLKNGLQIIIRPLVGLNKWEIELLYDNINGNFDLAISEIFHNLKFFKNLIYKFSLIKPIEIINAEMQTIKDKIENVLFCECTTIYKKS